jgi:hypothetical protein
MEDQVMKNRRTFSLSATAAVAALGIIYGSWAIAADPPAKPPMSKEQRQKMALVHEKAAACLRSDRSMAECHQEMMKMNGGSMSDKECQMMDGHMMGDKTMHGGKTESTAKPDAKP